MPDPSPAALDFLLTRRSHPARTLTGPAPDRDTLRTILTAAARSPDHGKLEPWRFIVLTGAAMTRLAGLVEVRGTALGRTGDDIAKAAGQFDPDRAAVVVVEVPEVSAKVPMIEQSYCAGAVCLALLNAALASGWGANWLTGWASHDAAFRAEGLGLADHERIAGIIHIGTATRVPPERPRPDIAVLTTWVSS